MNEEDFLFNLWLDDSLSFFFPLLNHESNLFVLGAAESTSEVGKGNYRPTYDSGDRSDMVYGVFNTPQ